MENFVMVKTKLVGFMAFEYYGPNEFLVDIIFK